MSYASREQFMKSACAHAPQTATAPITFKQISLVDRTRSHRTGRGSISDATSVIEQREKPDGRML